MLDGLSPRQMWEAGLQARPLRKLPNEMRYALASHKKVVRVTQRGIVLDIGKDRICYANERLAGMIGQEVLAFYHIDFPELLTVTDMQRQNSFSVRAAKLPASTATREQFEAVMEGVGGFRRAMRAGYGNLRHQFASSVTRDNAYSDADKALGASINQELAATNQAKQAEETKQARAQRLAAELGIDGPRAHQNLDRWIEGAELERQGRAEMRREQRLAQEAMTEGNAE